MAFTSKAMRVDPELEARIKALGEDASLTEIFVEIHKWTKEQIAENERRQRIFARTWRWTG